MAHGPLKPRPALSKTPVKKAKPRAALRCELLEQLSYRSSDASLRCLCSLLAPRPWPPPRSTIGPWVGAMGPFGSTRKSPGQKSGVRTEGLEIQLQLRPRFRAFSLPRSPKPSPSQRDASAGVDEDLKGLSPLRRRRPTSMARREGGDVRRDYGDLVGASKEIRTFNEKIAEGAERPAVYSDSSARTRANDASVTPFPLMPQGRHPIVAYSYRPRAA